MRRRWAVVLGVLACLLPLTPSPARANHTPLNEDGLKWENAAGADFNLEIAWTQGYVAQGAAFQQRVRDVVARDPSCFAGSCTSTSYARWYLHQAQPYFGGAESTVADFDPRSGTPVSRCGMEGSVSLHWLAPSRSNALAETWRCPYDASDPRRVFSSQVVVNPSPPSPGTLDTSAANCLPGPYVWFTAGPADANNDAPACRTYDLMSVLAHEVGHVLGFWEYRLDASGANSVEPGVPERLGGQGPRLGNNTNRETMCIPIFSGSERQRTPEEHEKDAFSKLYPPTGPAPTITPATQRATSRDVTWNVSVPKDPNRATSFHMIYGDGTYDTRAIAQGTGSATFTVSHPFASIGTYTQRATIVETGAQATAVTISSASSANFVGYMYVRGANTGTETVRAEGLDNWNGSQPMRQAITGPTNGSVVSSDKGGVTDGGNWFKVKTAGIDTNLRYLRAGTYDVNVQNGNSSSTYGYTNHTTWNDPGGDCMTWTIGTNTMKVGTVTYANETDGVINSAKDLLGNNITADASGYYKFTLPTGMNPTNGGVYEQAVCISSADSVNGNQAPLEILNVF